MNAGRAGLHSGQYHHAMAYVADTNVIFIVGEYWHSLASDFRCGWCPVSRLDELYRQYHRSLGDKRDALRCAWDALCDEDAGTVQAEDFHQQLHRLAGSAGTYGYPEIARQALALEQGWTAWLRQSAHQRAPAYQVCAGQAAGMVKLLATMQAEIEGGPD